MSGLLGPDGLPISSAHFKKERPPKLGEAFGQWSGKDAQYLNLPGGGTIGFDLNRLTLADYRNMKNHYQIHSSLAVLSFMQHQSEWHIECEDKKIRDFITDNLTEVWTDLSRSLSRANWAGYSPNVLQWENDIDGRRIELAKVKDLTPETCYVNWKKVQTRPNAAGVRKTFQVYDGIQQWGAPDSIPVEASMWYPLLMEDGDYNGTKLLKPAFTSWYFSILLHLFANRYYERFGEPTPIARAPMDGTVAVSDTEEVSARDYMLQVLANLRSRGAVVLPGDKNPDDSGSGNKSYEYDIEYMESQMRGADFERYMTRLDEEMSIGLFTPILLLRTADVGSYNLGVGHMQMYLWMLNAMNGDRKKYIDKYVLTRMVDYNFGKRAARARIQFRKMGNSNTELIKAVLVELIKKDGAKVDLNELGELAGLTLKEVQALTAPDPADAPDGGADPANDPTSSVDGASGNPRDTAKAMRERIGQQVSKAYARGSKVVITPGYRKRMENAFHSQGLPVTKVDTFFDQIDMFQRELSDVQFSSGDEYMGVFGSLFDNALDGVLSGV